MRVAFASEVPAGDLSGFSGAPYYMSQAIRAEAESFEYIQTPSYDWSLIQRADANGYRQIEACGRYLTECLRTSDADVVVCSGAAMIPYLETDKTVVLWHDSMWFTTLRLRFEEFGTRYPMLYEWDRLSLAKCDLVVFAAEWLREQTLGCYDVPSGKIHVIPFGANIQPPSEPEVREMIAARDVTPCRLTFLGIDWRRKGLPLAYEVFTKLKADGLRAEFSIIGCTVPRISRKHRLRHYLTLRPLTDVERFQLRFSRDPSVAQIGLLKKENKSQYDRLRAILEQTHFLLHPAEFEPFGIALAEANAFGIPVLATAGYGPETIVREGCNGHLYERSDYVAASAEFIRQQMRDRATYESLAMSSFIEYRDRLNWSVSWRKLAALVRSLPGKRTRYGNLDSEFTC